MFTTWPTPRVCHQLHPDHGRRGLGVPPLAGETHRDHAIIEQVLLKHAELKNGPLAHAPSGKVLANAAWLALACVVFNLLRAGGAAASARHAKARWSTLRTHLIAVPARIASSSPPARAPFAHELALGARLGRPQGHRQS